MTRSFTVWRVLSFLLILPGLLTAQYEGSSPFCHQGGGLFINEISNGPTTGQNNKEYIELVVTPDPANPLAPVNLEGWILDDNNVAEAGEGNASGHFILGDCYQAVPPGSILVFYNPEDPNPDLPPDDPTDADQDGVYIIPANDPCVLTCNSNPTSADPTYCPCSDPDAPVAAWQIGLRNPGDLFQVRDDCETVVHAISWGGLQLSPEVQNSPAYFRLNGDSQSGLVIRFTNFISNDWNDPTNYDNPPVATGQSPGAPNNAANADFILQLQNGTFNECAGTIFDCKLTDAGDLAAPAGSTDLPITLCLGEDLGPFAAVYDQPDENEPQAPGFNFEYAFLLTGDQGPDFPLLAFNPDGDFDLSTLPEGNYRIWGLSYIQTNGSVSVDEFLSNVVTSIEEIRSFTACGYDADLDSLDQNGQLMSLQIVSAPTAVAPDDPLQACSDTPVADFDLTTYDALISGGSALPVRWYSDAGATQPIPDPANYSAPGGTVFARLENGSCQSNIVSLLLEVGGNLDIQIRIDEAPDCDDPLGTISLNIADPGDLDINWNINQWDGEVVLTGVAPGTYSVTVTDPGGCLDTASVRLNSVSALFAEYITTSPTCTQTESGAIRLGEVIGGNSPYEISFNGGDYQPAVNWSVSGLSAGDYVVQIRDNAGCETAQSISLRLPPGPVLDLGPDLEIESGMSTFIVPNLTVPLTALSWSPQAGITLERDGLTIQPAQTTTYVFTATAGNGCTATDELTVTVIPPDMPPPDPETEDSRVFIPNAFSPNEDGVNDTFTIYGDEEVANIDRIRIFDRWGDLVYEAEDLVPNDIQQGWRGMYNGRQLGIGVYIYFAEITYTDGTTGIFKGEVMLMR